MDALSSPPSHQVQCTRHELAVQAVPEPTRWIVPCPDRPHHVSTQTLFEIGTHRTWDRLRRTRPEHPTNHTRGSLGAPHAGWPPTAAGDWASYLGEPPATSRTSNMLDRQNRRAGARQSARPRPRPQAPRPTVRRILRLPRGKHPKPSGNKPHPESRNRLDQQFQRTF